MLSDKETRASNKLVIAVVSPLNPASMHSGLEERIQVLSEGLAFDNEVFLLFPRSGQKYTLPNHQGSRIKLVPFGNHFNFDQVLRLPPLHPLRFLSASNLLHSVGLYTSLRSCQPEAVVVEFPYNFAIPKLYCFIHRVPILLSEQNVESILIRRAGERFHVLVSAVESAAVRLSDCTVCTSQHDKDRLTSMVPRKKIEVIPNGVSTSEYDRLPEDKRRLLRERLGFSGVVGVFHGSMDYPPNRIAAKWLDDSVVPLIRRRYREFEMIIAGRQGDGLRLQNSTYLGFVPKLNELLQCCDIALAPLISGSGTKLKILQYLSSGIPTVTTTVGAEGLELRDREEILIAPADPSLFAEAAIEILGDQILRNRLSEKGRQLVAASYDWQPQVAKLAKLVREVSEGKKVRIEKSGEQRNVQ